MMGTAQGGKKERREKKKECLLINQGEKEAFNMLQKDANVPAGEKGRRTAAAVFQQEEKKDSEIIENERGKKLQRSGLLPSSSQLYIASQRLGTERETQLQQQQQMKVVAISSYM